MMQTLKDHAGQTNMGLPRRGSIRRRSRIIRRLALLVALFLPPIPGVQAEGPDHQNSQVQPDARFERIGRYLEQERARQGIPGLSAAIVLDGRTAWSKALGVVDLEHDVPARSDSVYRIGAVSRFITAVAVMRLVAQGKVDLHENIREYVPEFPDKGTEITIRHVLAHQSGIRTFRGQEQRLNRRHYRRLVDTLVLFRDDPLAAPPGQKFLNSAWAYNLLGLLIERLGGEPFDVHLQRQVFGPLGMSSSGLDDPAKVIPHRARGYARGPDGAYVNAPVVDLSDRYPAAGMVSSTEDLARLAAALLIDRLMPPAYVKVMTTAHKTSDGREHDYGLGCFVRTEEGRNIFGHAGWPPGGSALLMLLPDQRAAIVILANLESVDVSAPGLEVARMLFDEAP